MRRFSTQAWYFPNWHVTPLNEKWHGKGWTEWQVVKYATPRFPGHTQPKTPLWGYADEADPRVFEQKIRAARDHGIDGFIFDFYWFPELGSYRRDCLDKGFLGATNNEEMEFSLMWCNHDPIAAHPTPYGKTAAELRWGSGMIDLPLFHTVTEFCIENYFSRKNYRRVNGKCYFGIWNMGNLIKSLGGLEAVGEAMRDFRARAKARGHEIHFAAHAPSMPLAYRLPDERDEYLRMAGILTVDSVFYYNWDFPKVEHWPTIDYSDYRAINEERYAPHAANCPLPLDLTVSVGWDSSPRTVQSDMYEEGAGYARNPIVVGNTPELVEGAFRAAREFAESDAFTGNAVTIATWNEWTEGNYMEPDSEHGYGFLEACGRVFGDGREEE
ncbi:MAG: glycoside hydrolase family 99-like domain-containing protein [Clostridia bacterium]|nr:glycoside hydrolase family 99-like domain-containing protein [Clostridia bacterium]